MSDLYDRPDSWTDYLPQSWQSAINTSPVLNALGRAINRPAPNLERASIDIFGRPEDKAEADRQWLLQQARGPSFLERMNPVAQDAVNKLGLYANFVGPAAKLPPPAPKPTGIRAYHGSPHDFDKFDIRKSGGDLFFSDSEVFANTYRPKGGRTYEVNINASPDQFLDLDVPFSQQSALVKNSLKEAWRVPDAAHGDTGRALYSKMIQKSDTPNQYEDLAIAAGIPGLKYKDALAGKASQSYVLWDDSLIEILRKYGLWPLVPAGTAAALDQQEPQL